MFWGCFVCLAVVVVVFVVVVIVVVFVGVSVHDVYFVVQGTLFIC